MAERVGVCSGCNARYKIPPTYPKTTAKCKKCGAQVDIPALEGQAAAPAAEPSKPTQRGATRTRATRGRPQEASAEKGSKGTQRSSARGSGRRQRGEAAEKPAGRGGRSERASRGGRGRGRASTTEKSKNTLIFAAVGVMLIVGGGLGVWSMFGSDEESTPPIANAADSGATPEAASEPEIAVEEDAASSGDPATADPAPADGAVDDQAAEDSADDSSDAAPVEEPVQEEVRTLFEFAAFPKTPDATDEEWQQILDAAEGMSFGGKRRKDFMAQLKPFGLKGVPAVINTLNGTDLEDPTSWRDAWEVAVFLQDELTFKAINIPLHGDFSTEYKEVSHNSKCMQSLLDYWTKKSESAEEYEKIKAKFERLKAEAEG